MVEVKCALEELAESNFL